MSQKFIQIDRCPVHPEFYAIAVGDEHSSTRLTPSKCCGRWQTIKQWPLTPRQIDDIVTEIQCLDED